MRARSTARAAVAARRRLLGPQIARASTVTASSEDPKPLFDKVLIANRGEVACRVIRTARQLGVKTVAVYSEADAKAMHVKMADEAYLLGPAPSSESYLRIDKIVQLCHESGAKAVHPGWGFLSERAEFAERLQAEGITFIGPPSSAIISMGSKSESKDIMLAAGVPCVPGYHGPNQDPDFLLSEAKKIGFPVLVKAIKGGGGKGMKIAMKEEEFFGQLESSQREGEQSFGDGTVLLEKYLLNPRHVEVQVFADTHGNVVHLFERDCSVQRRHQKIIEEAPAPGLSEETRAELGRKAVDAARAVGYVGAGTVEFIMGPDGDFYYMEMNTRLQVEHPITEMITGQDLVQWQLEVAAGNPLPLTQDQIKRNGHAFEARIYAESPRRNFLPDVGTLVHVRTPKESKSVRVETGAEAGDEISVFYDPMIAKLVVHGRDRQTALSLLHQKLSEYQVVGPSTNIEFLKTLASHPAFVRGEVETGFIPRYYDELFPPLKPPSDKALARAGVFEAMQEMKEAKDREPKGSPWASLQGFRMGGAPASRAYRFGSLTETAVGESADAAAEGPQAVVDVSVGFGGQLDVSVLGFSGEKYATVAKEAKLGGPEGKDLTASVSGVRQTTTHVSQPLPSASSTLFSAKHHIFDSVSDEGDVHLGVPVPKWLAERRSALGGAGKGSAKAPMPSKVVKVQVKAGDEVEEGQALVVLEAMKTEVVIRAPKAAKVATVNCEEGGMVGEGQELVVFDDA